MDHLIFTTILKSKSLAAVLERRKPTNIFRIASLEIKIHLTSWYHSSCASIEEYPVENNQPNRGYPSLTEQISALCKDGQLHEALDLWTHMGQQGVPTDSAAYSRLLQGCIKMKALAEGTRIHVHMVKHGFKPCLFLYNNLINMYAKCGSLEDACQVFDKVSKPDVISWNVLISGYAQHGLYKDVPRHFCRMHRMGMKPNHFTFASVLSACANLADLEHGKQVHSQIVASGYENHIFVGNALVDMYAKCRVLKEAHDVFDEMTERDEVSWNALLTGYAQNGHSEEALEHFRQMQQAGLKLTHFTFGSVLKACSSVAAQEHGKQVHGRILKSGFESDVYVGSAMVDMYAKCGSLDDALTMFYNMPDQNVVTWNAMIAGIFQAIDVESCPEYGEQAMNIFRQMQRKGMKPNHFTFSSILGVCSSLAYLENGKQIHVQIIKGKFELDEFVGSALVDMYAKCTAVEDAHKWFDKMPKQDIVSWTTMITGYAQNGHCEDAFKLFRQVLRAGMKPDQFTLSSILSASASIAVQEQGKQVHAHTIKIGCESLVVVGNALIGMYAKCGSIDDACSMFCGMSKRDVVSWSVLISGYAQHGCGKEALQLFGQMQEEGMKPNHITFVGVLSACSHVGLVDEGCRYFDSMTRDHGVIPKIEHYACVVDLLGRAGRLDEAEQFINEMKLESDAVVWRALLGASRIHGNMDTGKRAAEHVIELEPKTSGTYVLLSNIYASSGKWDDVTKVRNMMKDKGVKKEPGLSWIEVGKTFHSFAVGDRSHPQTGSIYAKLESLMKEIKEAGYVPDTNFALHDVEQEQKEKTLAHHSEKLAIAFGLISIPHGTPIKVIKNLRVCGDCHTASKFISRVSGREIVLRDGNRFHHFKDGLCSCGDYW